MTAAEWQRIKEVLEGALECELPERTAFLENACGGDEALRAHVEQLLASDENVGDFLSQPALGAARVIEELEDDDDPEDKQEGSELIGARFGRYTIASLIGKGGMGTVYRAVREDDFRMDAAIKVLKRGTDTDNALRRFRVERQILAGLQHPNIARLLDGGATESGLPYLVMEFVDGKPLLEYAAPLSIRGRLLLFRSVCSAVHYAHRKQVVHRDIKPANIVVTSDGAAKLLDFGIAKLLDPAADGATATTLTATGARVMTPGYASPEQVRGEPVTAATDVYSLGAVLYELLTGERAHQLEKCSPGEIEAAICTRDPKKPSSVAKDLDTDLDNIVMKALRKEPERRYGSVAELMEDLDCFLNDRPVKAKKESPLYSARKFARRNRAPIAAAALSVLAVLMLVAGLNSFKGLVAPQVRPIAVLPLTNLSSDPDHEYLADGMTETLIANLSRFKSLRPISVESVMGYRNAARTSASIARELNVEALVEGSIVRSENRVEVKLLLRTGAMDRAVWTQTYNRDLQDLPAMQSEAAKTIARQIGIRLTPDDEALPAAARPVNPRAYEAYLRGRYQVLKYTQDGFKKGIEYLKEAIDIDSAYAPAWAALADGYLELSSVALPPREAMPKARAAAQRALEIDPTLPEPHATLAQIQSQYDWDWAKAETSLKRTLELNPSFAQGHFYYGQYLIQQGRLKEAIREMEAAYKLDPLPPRRATNVGWAYHLAGNNDEAIARFRKILDLDPGTAMTYYSLGMAYKEKGMVKEAAAAFLQALKHDPSSPAPTAFLAHLYATSGNPIEARRWLEKLLQPEAGRYVPAYLTGLVYVGLGETSQAFEFFEKAFEERSEELLFLKVDPRLDTIRSDPRYKSLLRRIGLPP